MQKNIEYYRRVLKADPTVFPDPLPANYIDNLHEYFFLQIFEQIDNLVDQVRMARAYPKFLPEIINYWRKQSHLQIVGPNTQLIGILGFEDYVFYMRHMAGQFKELHVYEEYIGFFPEVFDYLKHLGSINLDCFTSIHSCILAGRPTALVNEDIRDLSLILPNLKRLMISMNLSGAYIMGFKKLEQLVIKSMYHSVPLESRWIQEICVNMTKLRLLDITDSFNSNIRLDDIYLPNLEVLKLNLSTVETIVPQVLQLPKLRRLAIRYDDCRHPNADQETIFQEILVARMEDITKIGLNNKVVQLPMRWQHSLQLELPNLRSIVCSNWTHDEFFLDRRHIPCAQMQTLSFTGWEILRENELLELVTECTQLTQLGLNGYHSTLDKLRKLAYIRYREKNKQHLEVYSDNMWRYISPDDFKHWNSKDKYIKITGDGNDFEYEDDGFEFNFAVEEY